MVAPGSFRLRFSSASQEEFQVPLPPDVRDRPESRRTNDIILPRGSLKLKEGEQRKTDLPNIGGFFFWTLFVLGLLVIFFVLLRRWVRKGRWLGAGVIRVLARKGLAPRHEVFLVEVGSKVFLVGATRDQLSTLGEFSDPKDVAAVRSLSPSYAADSVEAGFRRTLKEGLIEEETTPPSRTTFQHLVDEVKHMKETVMSWKG